MGRNRRQDKIEVLRGAPEWLARGIASAIKNISEQREEMRREGARA